MGTTDLEATNIDSYRHNHITQTICDIVNYEKLLALEGLRQSIEHFQETMDWITLTKAIDLCLLRTSVQNL
jgi:hypothetical protein